MPSALSYRQARNRERRSPVDVTRRTGTGLVAGVDEAGRGPLAGPVMAAAVILDPARPIDGLDDSKKLTAAVRQRLALRVREDALAWAVAWADTAEIDSVNILQASLLAMTRAVLGLVHCPDTVLVDGSHCPPLAVAGLACTVRACIGGDGTEPAISAASILAKVRRDELMQALHLRHPDYGFDSHKGYPTAAHRQALERFGPCREHRVSFAPVRRLLEFA